MQHEIPGVKMPDMKMRHNLQGGRKRERKKRHNITGVENAEHEHERKSECDKQFMAKYQDLVHMIISMKQFITPLHSTVDKSQLATTFFTVFCLYFCCPSSTSSQRFMRKKQCQPHEQLPRLTNA